ncbi:1,6-anhydro-N-acetylmuramyl-L-alanine amidase AmpD [Vibrio stylophorae]|uniref:1,6-anhydro-N-acetylmuramyl-L-alanine amidase AmpD n=1 Tax=Vibrio stylophorae TaxID=659351 RepID=A0ABN8DYJ0_9VIBR|nr:1,6-anhydro-N-acetylmuramyl-L-alanine amidase AmpD [Vibrio stylophorae]CAH0534432.1 1,6-anhydro-N-acetylmuramyl-L-alanine amidase AmpD [Vibrio stylophorae]
MFTISSQHWVNQAKQLPSPYFNQRPVGTAISLLVIHNISLPPAQFGTGYIADLFLGQLDCDAHPYFHYLRGLEVSAHCVISRTGELLQFVPFDKRAWHAGASSFAGVTNCNDYAIGIELEGTDTQPYTEAQYQTLAMLTQALQQHYPQISDNRITGHQFIAPLRKSDPGLSFDWSRYFRDIKS